MLNLFIILSVYFVSFIDKPEKTAPQLSERAKEQRERWNIPTDAMDYPVSPMYMGELRKRGIQIYHYSRWFNGATVEMTEEQAAEVAALKFVTDVEMTRDNSAPIYGLRKRLARQRKGQRVDMASADNSSYTDDQLNLYNLKPLHEAGFEGQGILMAICDGGFYNADKLNCFRQKELELGHFDLTDDTDDFYGSTGDHGTECLSVISGEFDEYFHGAASKAPYYLMRSEEVENNRESPKEMDNLVVALEKADSLGVNVFSVSLGYAMFDNDAWTLDKTTELDGKTTRVSRAATIAARKGMLVCAAAGNEGNDTWKMIDAPADADSILTVGAVNTSGRIAYFSSYGPSSDGRIKPDVCALGQNAVVIVPTADDGYLSYNDGTSFATPLLAGLAASLWSALPKENAMMIRERIIRSADRYDNPSPDRYGYGIPDAWKAYTMVLDDPQDIEDVQRDDVPCTKILRNGQILILRDNKAYDIMGNAITF